MVPNCPQFSPCLPTPPIFLMVTPHVLYSATHFNMIILLSDTLSHYITPLHEFPHTSLYFVFRVISDLCHGPCGSPSFYSSSILTMVPSSGNKAIDSKRLRQLKQTTKPCLRHKYQYNKKVITLLTLMRHLMHCQHRQPPSLESIGVDSRCGM